MNSVSIVIPTLFPPKNLAEYVSRLASFQPVTEVIVVVNGNGQDYVENTIQWHFLGKNKGFTGACNEGARLAKSELLLFLNDDCQLTQEALSALLTFIENNEDIVATQPIITKSLEPRAQNLEDAHIENIGFWVDTKIGKAYPVQNQEEIQKHTWYGLSGTCILIKKDIFEKVGMFDVSFHSYLEDVDLAIRLHKAGYTVAPCPSASAVHEHMGTSNKMGLYKPLQDVKNWWRLVFKHPDIFQMSLPLFVERARNLSGLLKAAVTSL